MSEAAETVHVVFGRSVADTLREALAERGLEERVIGLPDGLNVGPIDPADPHVRQAWGLSVLRADPVLRDGLIDDPVAVETAWTQATAPDVAPVFWACLNSPAEHACFLAFAARVPDRSFDIVDATDSSIATAGGTGNLASLGGLRVRDFVGSRLHETRQPLSTARHRAASEAWAQLQRENAPFRIVRDGRLVSAPLTHYDGLLIAQARPDWDIAARLIGRAMTTLADGRCGEATSDVVLFGRILALAEQNLLEIAGSGPGLRDYRVRKAVA